MNGTANTPFRGKDGLHGWVEAANDASGRPAGTDAADWASVRLADGRRAHVPRTAFVRQDDGSLYLPLGPADLTLDAGTARQTTTVTLVEERLRVDKQEVETGTVRVRKVVRERQEAVDVPLGRERVEVERVPLNRTVEAAPPVRQEGDVTIIPVVEEVLVVEKRLVLREEVRITRRRDETREPQTVTLRREEVEVTREDANGRAVGGPTPR
ncbi:MAG: hypothetical protein JWO31_414 [Phycisphaerales bacterium]|nr:hypothetical protein [Phycisphaerales bacterium]